MNKIKQCFVSFFFIWQCFSTAFAATTWQTNNLGITAQERIYALAFHPTHHQEMYAGSFFGGLYKTTDGAKNWSAIANDIFQGKFIANIIFNPKNSDEIFVLTEKAGIWKSADDGDHWQLINERFKNHDFSYMVINPANTSEFYASSFFKGLFKSTDGGANWEEIKIEINDVGLVGRIKMHPLQPKLLLLQAWIGWDARLLKSIDGGAHWTLLPLKTYIADMDFAPDNPQVIYACCDAGLFKSEDGGTTWKLLFKPEKKGTSINTFILDKKNSNVIYAHVNHDGIYKTEDGGKNWHQVTDRFQADNFEWNSLLLNPSNDKDLFVSTKKDGLFHSLDSGTNWEHVNKGILNVSILSIASSPTQPGTILAGTAENGLLITRDGAHWSSAAPELGAYSVSKIAWDPNNAANIAILVQKRSSAMYTDIYYSHDNAKTWQEAKVDIEKESDFIPNAIAFNPANSNELLAGNYFSNEIWKSIDAGATWHRYSRLSENTITNIFTLTFNPKNPNEIYVGTEELRGRLLFKSEDQGKTWTQFNYNFAATARKPNLSTMHAFAMDTINPLILYASARIGNDKEDVHFYKSIDAGKTWTIIGKGLPAVEEYQTIIVDPKDNKTIYVTTGTYSDSANLPSGDGIYVSHDAGETFAAMNEGLTNLIATSLTLNENKLFTGTEGSGVYTR